MLRVRALLLAAAGVCLLVALAGGAETKRVPHPFILWTDAEAAAIRRRVETDPAARKQLERTLSVSHHKGGRPTVIDLFRAQVQGEESAAGKGDLLGFIGRKPEPLTWDVDPAKLQWNVGMPSAGDRHMRDEQTENVLRYDLLYDELTPAQRGGIERAFRTYIQFHLDGHPPRHPAFAYDRTSWLPNMHWPRPIGTHLMALVMQDQGLIEKMFRAEGGWKWYFDEYVADHGFYMEEFGKVYSNIGSMIFWCEGLEELGLDRYGYGYVGRNGATFKSFLKANTLDITYPRTDWGGGMPSYGRVTMGDAKGHAINGAPVQHAIVAGYLADGRGGHLWASSSHMNGPMSKFREPFWFEAAHARWPDEGFDYFLAAFRKPGEETYYPTLLFNLEPVDPAKVKPPAPYPSFVARQRGFAMLKADHSPAYWESWKPAVALQFARYYVHYVHDCFSLLGYHAYNAPIYLNAGGSGSGYAGGNAWKDSVRGHSGVLVDNLQAQPVARKDDGTVGHAYREDLEMAGGGRFVAVRAAGVYPDVDMERALLLTDDYLFDVFWLDSARGGQARLYDWQVQSPCSLKASGTWRPTDELSGGALYNGSKFEGKAANGKQDPVNLHKRDVGGDDWDVTLAYESRTDDPADDPVLGGFTKRGVGVKVHLLGEDGTTAYVGNPPGAKGRASASVVIVRRRTPDTVFVALHDPFDGGEPHVRSFERIARDGRGVAVRVVGEREEGGPIDDRILVRYGDGAAESMTLAGGGESFTFADHALVRISGDRVDVGGDLRAMKLKVGGRPRLVVNGKPAEATVSGGTLTYRAE